MTAAVRYATAPAEMRSRRVHLGCSLVGRPALAAVSLCVGLVSLVGRGPTGGLSLECTFPDALAGHKDAVCQLYQISPPKRLVDSVMSTFSGLPLVLTAE